MTTLLPQTAGVFMTGLPCCCGFLICYEVFGYKNIGGLFPPFLLLFFAQQEGDAAGRPWSY